MTGEGEGKPGAFRRMTWGAARWIVGTKEIGDGWDLIRTLWASLGGERPQAGAPPRRDVPRLGYESSGLLLGLDAGEIDRRLAERRVETRRRAWLSLAVGGGGVIAWLFEMVFMSWTGNRLVGALEFLPWCAAALIYAFYNAWLNWQVRRGRPGSAAEFMSDPSDILPR
jgi:hypothetical protein